MYLEILDVNEQVSNTYISYLAYYDIQNWDTRKTELESTIIVNLYGSHYNLIQSLDGHVSKWLLNLSTGLEQNAL